MDAFALRNQLVTDSDAICAWNKDRGKNPDGSERLNDLHFTRAAKLEARKGDFVAE